LQLTPPFCRKPLANIIVDEDEGKAHAVSEASGVKEGANHPQAPKPLFGYFGLIAI
jgi:hypothetical protein